MSEITMGKPGKNMRKYCGGKVVRKNTKRGVRYMLSANGTKAMRFVSEKDADRLRDKNVCVYLPILFGKR